MAKKWEKLLIDENELMLKRLGSRCTWGVFTLGDCNSCIHLWEPSSGATWNVDKNPLVGHAGSVEDIQVLHMKLASCMIASGSDDGTFTVRDLRRLKTEEPTVAHFTYHKQPITSIEWSPHEASTLAVTSSDNQLTIWDLSLEKDEEEEAEFRTKIEEQVIAPEDLPPQLLFVHQGQKDLKELHWHAQIPGMVVSTAGEFSVEGEKRCGGADG
ncbi:hypothetical protein QQ045_010233 [Rhodiola kirilowii]